MLQIPSPAIVQYDDQLLPRLVYRVVDTKVTLLIFATGKGFITGKPPELALVAPRLHCALDMPRWWRAVEGSLLHFFHIFSNHERC